MDVASTVLVETGPPGIRATTGSAEAPLAFYWAIVRRYAARIATFVLFVTVIVTLVSLSLPKQYAATAILRIDPASDRTVGEQNNSNSSFSMNTLDLMTTEASLVTSPAVVQQTIDKLHLDRNPEFAPKGAVPGVPLTQSGANEVLVRVAKAISVDQPLNSYLLSVSFRSHDPQLSAQVANDLLRSLIQHDYETRTTALNESSESMQAQLIDLRAKMEQAQQALVQYESSKDVLSPDSSTNIMQSRLSQVNQDLGQAQTQRITLEAEYEIVKSGDVDALIASDRGQSLQPLYQRLQLDRFKLAQMAQMYGPNYPVYRQQESLVSNDETVLREEEKHTAGQVASEYNAALAKEKLLTGALGVQKQSMDAFNLKAIRYYALKASSDAYSKLYYQLQQSVQDASVAASLHSESLRLVNAAQPVTKAVYPRPLLAAALSFIFALCLGVGCAIVWGILDRSLSTPEQVEQLFNLAVLTALPQVSGREVRLLVPMGYGPKLLDAAAGGVAPADEYESSPFREAVLGLHSAIKLMQDRDLQVIAVTSSVPAEGKTTLSANLAAAFSGLGGPTLLIDTDMRKPGVHRQFQLQNRRGLSSLLRGQCMLEQVLNQAPGVPNLTIMTAGSMPTSPAQLLQLGLGDLLEQLRLRFDHIIIDCPPALGFADALAPANLANGCILVVHADQTERQTVAAALRQLRSARTEMLGIVLNNVSQKRGAYYSYYSHYYSYHHTAEGNDPEAGELDE